MVVDHRDRLVIFFFSAVVSSRDLYRDDADCDRFTFRFLRIWGYTSDMRTGDLVIYRMNKHSVSPGRRARNLRPNPYGETYSYQVDKFWVVVDSRPDGSVEVATRKGKRRIVDSSDTSLRPARWWEKWIFADRFPKLPEVVARAS